MSDLEEKDAKRNVPKLRFPGFTDPWEQRKLGELFSEKDEKSSEMEILSVSMSKGVYPASESDRDTDPGASISKYKVVNRGDIVYNSMRLWQGAIDASMYDGIVSPAYVITTPQEGTVSRFFSRLLRRADMLFKYRRFSQGNSKDTLTLKFDAFAKIGVAVPLTITEQENIAACFDRVDDLITLRQRELEHAKELKRGLLQKMFPKEGSDVPEIRFPGFTDPWEQRKLGDEFEFLRNNTLSRAELDSSKGAVQDVHYGDILVKFGSVIDLREEKLPRIASDETASKLICDTLHDGDVVMADTAEDTTAGKCCELRKVGSAKVLAGLHTMPLRPLRAYAPGYLGHYLNSPAFRRQLVPLMQGVKVISLSRSAMVGTTIVAPSLKEQQEIGGLFETFDLLITLRQRELDHVKLLKKALLQQMFV